MSAIEVAPVDNFVLFSWAIGQTKVDHNSCVEAEYLKFAEL